MQRYQHPRLQGHRSTRLLQLEAAKSLADPLRCHLHEVSLDTNLVYEAISYFWGGQASNQEVFCSGRQLLVTPNAAMVLRHVRQQRQSRWIWIDSICINQNDVQEKNEQVMLMAEIYSKAVEVLLWLGESTKTSRMVLRSISSRAGREVKRKKDVAQVVLESDLFHDFLAIAIVKPLYACIGMFSASHKRMVALASSSDPSSEILANAVFERMWCVQEIALARRVRIIYGEDATTFEDLEFYLESLEKMMRTMDQSVKFKIHKSRMAIHHDLRTAVQAARSPQAGVHAPWPPLSVLLDCARKKGATKAKDKIFALDGIFKFMGVNLFPPDYRRPTWQVYREATVAAIQYDRSLDILYQITGLNKADFLPSWVPDYSITSSPTTPAYEFSRASGTSQPRWRFDFTTGDLCLLGVIIDRINECSTPLLSEPTNDSLLNETKTNATSASTLHVFKTWTSTALQLATYPTRESPVEAFARTLCTTATLRSNFAIEDFTRGFPKWLELINRPDPAASLENAFSDTTSRYSYESSHKSLEQRAYARELLATGLGSNIGVMTIGAERRAICLHYWLYLQCEQKALFVTRNGYLGIGSHSVCGGDMVVLFSGMNVPFVVRRMGACWALVAPVYVHGIMQGEWWDERRELEEFQLA